MAGIRDEDRRPMWEPITELPMWGGRTFDGGDEGAPVGVHVGREDAEEGGQARVGGVGVRGDAVARQRPGETLEYRITETLLWDKPTNASWTQDKHLGRQILEFLELTRNKGNIRTPHNLMLKVC